MAHELETQNGVASFASFRAGEWPETRFIIVVFLMQLLE